VTRYAFSEYSIEWLKEQRFREDEIDELQDILNKVESRRKDDPRLKLPKETGPKVAALAYLLDSITDVDGRPICFEDNGLIDIPDEARGYFEDDLEMEELELVLEKLKKTRFSRRYSYPKRRGSKRDNDKFGGV
jgi:hypothetical protein